MYSAAEIVTMLNQGLNGLFYTTSFLFPDIWDMSVQAVMALADDAALEAKRF